MSATTEFLQSQKYPSATGWLRDPDKGRIPTTGSDPHQRSHEARTERPAGERGIAMASVVGSRPVNLANANGPQASIPLSELGFDCSSLKMRVEWHKAYEF